MSSSESFPSRKSCNDIKSDEVMESLPKTGEMKDRANHELVHQYLHADNIVSDDEESHSASSVLPQAASSGTKTNRCSDLLKSFKRSQLENSPNSFSTSRNGQEQVSGLLDVKEHNCSSPSMLRYSGGWPCSDTLANPYRTHLSSPDEEADAFHVASKHDFHDRGRMSNFGNVPSIYERLHAEFNKEAHCRCGHTHTESPGMMGNKDGRGMYRESPRARASIINESKRVDDKIWTLIQQKKRKALKDKETLIQIKDAVRKTIAGTEEMRNILERFTIRCRDKEDENGERRKNRLKINSERRAYDEQKWRAASVQKENCAMQASLKMLRTELTGTRLQIAEKMRTLHEGGSSVEYVGKMDALLTERLKSISYGRYNLIKTTEDEGCKESLRKLNEITDEFNTHAVDMIVGYMNKEMVPKLSKTITEHTLHIAVGFKRYMVQYYKMCQAYLASSIEFEGGIDTGDNKFFGNEDALKHMGDKDKTGDVPVNEEDLGNDRSDANFGGEHGEMVGKHDSSNSIDDNVGACEETHGSSGRNECVSTDGGRDSVTNDGS